MKELIFKGSAVALVTPMKADLSIDYDLLGALLEDQIANKTAAVVVAGTSGEGSTLSDEEHMEIIRYTVKRVKGRIPVIAGAGSNNTAHAVELSKTAEKMGADALLHVTPYYNKTSQAGLYQHFSACAKAVQCPIILYNVPPRTGVNIQLETYQKLSMIDNIVAVKEASGNLAALYKVVCACGDDLMVYSGNDELIAPSLALGAKGVISVLANIMPKKTQEICEAFFDGDQKRSNELQQNSMPLIEALFSDVNPIPVKQALNDMGYPVGCCRLPLCDMEDIAKEKLRAVLSQYGLMGKNLQMV